MRKRNVAAVDESSYDYSYPSDGYEEYGGSGNIFDNIFDFLEEGGGGGGTTGFPQLPTLPTGTQQPQPNLDLYNLRCPDGFKIVKGKCKSVGTSGNTSDGGGANGGTNVTNDEVGTSGGGTSGGGANAGTNVNDEDVANGNVNGGSGASGTSGTRVRRKKEKKYLIPIVIIGVLAIGYFSIKKVIK